jgi:hypothetical protein
VALFRDPAARREFGVRGRALARREFGREVVAARLRRFYAELGERLQASPAPVSPAGSPTRAA